MQWERFLTSVRNDNNSPRLSFRPKGEIFLYPPFSKERTKDTKE